MKHDILNILHLEDNSRDVDLVAGWLEDEGINCEIRSVQTEAEFGAALAAGDLDLIISDFTLPTFDGLKALGIARERLPDVPFILFSGSIGEEFAIDCLKQGAVDYVLKQRPKRLIAAIRQGLAGAEQRAKRKEADIKLREQATLLDKAQDAIMVTDMEERITFWNRSAERIYGWSAAEDHWAKGGPVAFQGRSLKIEGSGPPGWRTRRMGGRIGTGTARWHTAGHGKPVVAGA